jgi:hypothetical protein
MTNICAGNCKKDGCAECSNAALMKDEQDFGKFQIGNKCTGDKDLDSTWVAVKCYWTDSKPLAPAWWTKNKWGECIEADKTCRDLGIEDNLCGKCSKVREYFLCLALILCALVL